MATDGSAGMRLEARRTSTATLEGSLGSCGEKCGLYLRRAFRGPSVLRARVLVLPAHIQSSCMLGAPDACFLSILSLASVLSLSLACAPSLDISPLDLVLAVFHLSVILVKSFTCQ